MLMEYEMNAHLSRFLSSLSLQWPSSRDSRVEFCFQSIRRIFASMLMSGLVYLKWLSMGHGSCPLCLQAMRRIVVMLHSVNVRKLSKNQKELGSLTTHRRDLKFINSASFPREPFLSHLPTPHDYPASSTTTKIRTHNLPSKAETSSVDIAPYRRTKNGIE